MFIKSSWLVRGTYARGGGPQMSIFPIYGNKRKSRQFVTLTVQKSMVAKGKNIETFTYCFYTKFALYNHLFGVPPLHSQAWHNFCTVWAINSYEGFREQWLLSPTKKIWEPKPFWKWFQFNGDCERESNSKIRWIFIVDWSVWHKLLWLSQNWTNKKVTSQLSSQFKLRCDVT